MKTIIPTGTENVLGLGLNYCIEEPRPKEGQRIIQTETRLLRSLQLGCYFGSFTNNDDDNNYDPKLYIPKNDWTPDPSDYKIKANFDRF